ncbi:MAG: AP2 domain-containing protein [Sedimentisphaerales bacterium]
MKVNVMIGIPRWLDRVCAWPVMVYRKWKYGCAFRRIYLGEETYAIVDVEDYYRYGKFQWCMGGTGKKCYAARGVRGADGKLRVTFLHRLIMNAPKGKLVDHKNGNSLDDRRANMRLATRKQNMQNRQKTSTKTSSRYIGVYFDRARKKWVAEINYRKRRVFLGRFEAEEAAARTYDEAAKRYRKDFARLNFPKN